MIKVWRTFSDKTLRLCPSVLGTMTPTLTIFVQFPELPIWRNPPNKAQQPSKKWTCVSTKEIQITTHVHESQIDILGRMLVKLIVFKHASPSLPSHPVTFTPCRFSVPEEYTEIVRETREIYSSPSPRNFQPETINKREHFWFPLVPNAGTRKLSKKPVNDIHIDAYSPPD